MEAWFLGGGPDPGPEPMLACGVVSWVGERVWPFCCPPDQDCHDRNPWGFRAHELDTLEPRLCGSSGSRQGMVESSRT